MQLPIELRVKIDFAEYWRATHSYMLGQSKFTAFVITAAVFLAVFIYRGITAPFDAPGYPLLIPPVAIIFLYGMLYLNTKYVFAGKRFLRHEVRYRFTGNGINAIGDGAPGETNWSEVPKAVELKNDFLIFYTAERMYVIPKRVFLNDNQISTFREMLRTHLGAKAKLAP